MTFANLARNTADLTVGGVSCKVRKHTIAFRNYLRLLTVEGRKLELDEEGNVSRLIDSGNIELYRKIVRETIKDGLVSWELKDGDGNPCQISDEVLDNLDRDHSEFLAVLFGEVELFNMGLDGAKKKR